MKEINIKIRFVNGKIGTMITQTFTDDIESIHTFVGVLENIKQQQLEKLKNNVTVIKKEENPDK